MITKKIAINGFGRIGRAFLRVAHARPDLEIVAINDLGDAEQFAYLLKYDSVYGQAVFEVVAGEHELIVGEKKIPLYAEVDPSKLPWGKLGIDVVVESTGFFTSYEKAKVHLDAGAKRVVITAPVKDEAPEGIAGATILVGINDDKFATSHITSNASCTTNASSPLIQILHEAIGIEKAILNTTHGYTASQNLVDGPVKHAKGKEDFRDGRAGAHNIVPSSTGAAIAVTKAIPTLAGKFDGISLRVPVIAGSIADVTFIASRNTTPEEVNDILKKAALQERWKPVFSVTEEPLVSSDILGSSHASIADLSMTRVVDGNLVKVLAWYDNEMGYTHALVEHVSRLAAHI
jgi:glyceraldehyde 3-phosphate dehydrogenase